MITSGARMGDEEPSLLEGDVEMEDLNNGSNGY
jgi:hypothetical protein